MANTPLYIAADDGFFFGLGAFETIAVEEGVPIFLGEHLARLEDTLDYLDIPVSHDELSVMVRDTLHSEGKRGRYALKITVTKDNRLCKMRSHGYDETSLERGFSCQISDVRRNETSPLAQMKTLNYGDCILEKRAAKAAGFDEPLFLNGRGEVAEGATTNVFAVFGDEVVTPPVDCGLLPGIMRGFALRALQAQERVISADDLLRADEAFLTNSLMGAMPVTSIGERVYGGHEVCRRFQAIYKEEVSRQRMRWEGGVL